MIDDRFVRKDGTKIVMSPARGYAEIKCLKGIWWMPWRTQAMKDVVRCEKFRGVANKL